MYSLSQHPEVEARLAAELAQHGLLATATQPSPRAIEWDDIPKLTYLQAVIKVWAVPVKRPNVQAAHVDCHATAAGWASGVRAILHEFRQYENGCQLSDTVLCCHPSAGVNAQGKPFI